jgi:hypothetical protein
MLRPFSVNKRVYLMTTKLSESDQKAIAQMMAEAFKQVNQKPKPGKYAEASQAVKTAYSWIPTTIIPIGAIVAGAVYNLRPVRWMMNWVVVPLTNMGASLLELPALFQVLLTYWGYEKTKEFLSNELCRSEDSEKRSIDVKKIAIYSLFLMYAAQDEWVRSVVYNSLTPTVLTTAAFCAVIDGANTGKISEAASVTATELQRAIEAVRRLCAPEKATEPVV